MKHFKEISSVQNNVIKDIIQLKEKSRVRKKTATFLIEGTREISLAIKGGYAIDTILFCTSIISEKSLNTIPDTLAKNWIKVTEEVYQKIAYRGTTEGIVAIAQQKMHHLNSITFSTKTPLILVAEAPEKPGNIGALLRTADAANVDAVLIANPKTDIYNPNIIRSSVGCIFTNQVATGSTEEIIDFLKSNHITIYCAALTAATPYTTQNFTEASALVVGTEATGLSETWLAASTQNIIIPMEGEIDSMNVSVAAAILIFEAKRQRLPKL